MNMKKETKTCQNCKNQFTVEPEDFEFYERIDVPAPTFCSECREQRRIAFRNELALYKRNCDLCGNKVVSRVSPDKKYPVFCNSCWWSDKWDPMEHGKDYDFSKPFFEQFHHLMQEVPHCSLASANNVNSDWVNQETDDKNCYLNTGGHFNEDSAYNTYAIRSKNCFDNFWILNSELCYKNINCKRCYKTFFSQDCLSCQDTFLSLDCRGCSNVFGCAGLRHKQYYIFNEKFSKEDYEKFLEENPTSSFSKFIQLEKKAFETWLSVPQKESQKIKSLKVSGNYISESKNAHNVWFSEKIEESKNFYIAAWIKDSYDGSSIGWLELSYEMAHSVGVYNGKFNAMVFGGKTESFQSSFLEYCILNSSNNNCFGCVSLRNKEYCILNKQYSKEEYESLIPKIKEHMMKMPYKGEKGRIYSYGEFFPIEISPFGYNETTAMDYYPLTRDEAIKRGYPWSDYESEKNVQFSDYKIPDDIKDVDDDILEKILKCEISGKPYKIIPMELQFYRRVGLPIPRRSPFQRHKDKIAKLPPRKSFFRKCQCAGEQSENGVYKNKAKHFHGNTPCPNEFETPYAPERKEIVYCEKCYQEEVV